MRNTTVTVYRQFTDPHLNIIIGDNLVTFHWVLAPLHEGNQLQDTRKDRVMMLHFVAYFLSLPGLCSSYFYRNVLNFRRLHATVYICYYLNNTQLIYDVLIAILLLFPMYLLKKLYFLPLFALPSFSRSHHSKSSSSISPCPLHFFYHTNHLHITTFMNLNIAPSWASF